MSKLRIYRRGSLLAVVLLLAIVLSIKWVSFSLWGREDDDKVESEELALFAASIDTTEQVAKHKILATRSTAHGPKLSDDIDRTIVTGTMSVTVSQPQRIELNSADSATLVVVKGIGPYTARKIMFYRKALGGFVSVSQLDEIEGLRAENLVNLKAMAYVDSSVVKPIPLNDATLKQLQKHPYISFVQAKAIVELRQHRRGSIAFSDLFNLEEFTSADLERLHPYLFE